MKAAPTGLTFGHHLAVVLDTKRIGPEHEGVLPVVERVQEDLHRVAIAEAPVPPALADDEAVGLRVIADDGHVEICLIDEEPHVRPLRGRLPLVGLLLGKRAVGVRGGPDLFVDLPVYCGPVLTDQVAHVELRHTLGKARRRDDQTDRHECHGDQSAQPGRYPLRHAHSGLPGLLFDDGEL